MPGVAPRRAAQWVNNHMTGWRISTHSSRRWAGAWLLCVPVLLFPASAASSEKVEKVEMDEVWPSVGPGSEGPRHGPHFLDLEVADSGAVVQAPGSSLSGFPEILLTPTLALGFNGVNGTAMDGFLHIPPDTQMTVGRGAGAAGRVIMITNSGIQIWDKMGTSVVGPMPLDTFLGTPLSPQPSAFDPRVIYDASSDRFIVSAGERSPVPTDPLTTVNQLHIAVSTSGTPNNLTSDWIKLTGDALTTIGATLTWCDYPAIGSDSGSVFATCNLFDAAGNITGIKIRVFDKAALMAGSYTFTDINLSTVFPFPITGATIQPAHVVGTTDNGHFYLINRITPTAYKLWEIAGAPLAPTIVGGAPPVNRTWSAGAQIPAGAPQSGTTVTLQTLSARIMNAVYHSGSVWLTIASDPDADFRTEAFWARIATNGGLPTAPTVADSGFIDPGGTAWAFMPAIAVNDCDDVVINYTVSGSAQFPDMRYASRTAATGAGLFDAPMVAAASPGFYDSFFTSPDRWGDYAATVRDPHDGTFWIANEIVRTSGVNTSIWDTFIGKTASVSGCANCANGAPCVDSDLCTTADTCSAGVCISGGPLICTPLDACHVAGVCAPATGLCSNPPGNDGAACTDGNGCTQTDTCLSGSCSGSNPKVCTAIDDCHLTGTCNPATGICSNPIAPDGTPCSDGDACTEPDVCDTATCVGGSPVVCSPLDQCHVAGTCNPVSGLCSNPAAPNGTFCNDGDPCSVSDTCGAGICQAGAPRDDDGDAHAASGCGGDDCDDTQSSVWATPDEVPDLDVTDATTLAWLPPANLGGAGVLYDLISSGDPADFVSSAVCVETDDGSDTTAVDLAIPGEGTALYYLVRPENSCPAGQGVLGRDSGGTLKPGRGCP